MLDRLLSAISQPISGRDSPILHLAGYIGAFPGMGRQGRLDDLQSNVGDLQRIRGFNVNHVQLFVVSHCYQSNDERDRDQLNRRRYPFRNLLRVLLDGHRGSSLSLLHFRVGRLVRLQRRPRHPLARDLSEIYNEKLNAIPKLQ